MRIDISPSAMLCVDWKRDRLARGARGGELGRARGFDTNDPDARPELLDRGRHAGAQAAATHRHEHRAHVGQVFDDLEADGALPGDDARVIERRDERRAFGLHEFDGAIHPILRRRPGEDDACTEPLGADTLGLGHGGRHNDGRLHAEQPRGERDGLARDSPSWAR